MAGYYRKIKGKNYDRELLELAEASVSGRGDGRISMSDARALLAGVKDADSYTDVEKRTIKYIRENFKFTKEADALFRTEIRKWAGVRGARTRKQNPPPSDFAAPPEPADDDDAFQPAAAAGGESGGSSWLKWLLIGFVIFLVLALIFLGMRHCGCKPGVDGPGKPGTDNQGKTGLLKPGKAGTPTAGKGITIEQVEKTVPVFKRGSSRLSPPTLQKLKLVEGYLKANPKSRLRITGHTCNLGSEKLNLRYSRRRAGAVARRLRGRGIPAKRIEIKAAGESSPIASNETEEGRSQNRRVQFKILD